MITMKNLSCMYPLGELFNISRRRIHTNLCSKRNKTYSRDRNLQAVDNLILLLEYLLFEMVVQQQEGESWNTLKI